MDRFGRYLVRGKLGTGAIGVVLDAFDPALNRSVAIKILRRPDTPVAEERFRREAQALARVQHPNVVHVYEAGSERGQLYVAMEHVSGKSLEALIREKAPRDRLLDVVEQAARGLHAAHEKGVLHRDVKPANILVDDATNRARIVDFGLARVDGALTVTTEDAVLGTPSYMAPELAGAIASKAGPWSDVYGLGATLFEALTGRIPYPRPDNLVELLTTLGSPDPEPEPRDLDSSVPDPISHVCRRAIAKRPEARFQDAGAFADALHAARYRPTRRRNALIGLLLVLVALLGAREVQRLVFVAGPVPDDGKDDGGSRVTSAVSPLPPPHTPPPVEKSLSEGAVLGVVEGRHAARIRHTMVSRDGRRVATAGEDAVRVWDAATGATIFMTPIGGADIAFAGGRGERLLTASLEGEIGLWDLQTGEKTDAFQHPALSRRPHALNTLAADDSGRYALCVQQRNAKLVDRKAKAVVVLRRQSVLCAALTPDGRHALIARPGQGEKSIVECFDVARAVAERRTEREPLWTVTPFEVGSPRLLAISPDGTEVAAVNGGNRPTIARWEIGAQRALSSKEQKGHGRVTALAYGPKSSILVARLTGDGTAGFRWGGDAPHKWQLPSREEIVALSPDGVTGFTAEVAALRCVRLADGVVLWGGDVGHEGVVTGLAQSGPGTFLSTGDDGTIREWRLDSNTELLFSREEHPVSNLTCDPASRRFAWTAGGTHAAAVGTTTRWDIAAPCSAAAILPGGGRYAGIADRAAWIGSVGARSETALVRSGTAVLACVAAAKDRIAAADRTGLLETWDASTGQPRGSLSLGVSPMSLSLSEDATRAVVCCDGQAPRVVDLAAGRLLGTLGNAVAVAAAVSPDGELAAAGDASGMVWLWAVRSQRRLSELDLGRKGHAVSALVFVDGDLLVGTARGPIVRLKVR